MQLGAGGRYLGPASAPCCTPTRPTAGPPGSTAHPPPRAVSPVVGGAATPSLHGGSCSIPCSPVLSSLPPAAHATAAALSLPFAAAACTSTEPGTATIAAATIAAATIASCAVADALPAHSAPQPLQGGPPGSQAAGGSGGARGAPAPAAAAAATQPSDAAVVACTPRGAGALPSPGLPTTPARSPLPTAASPRPSPQLPGGAGGRQLSRADSGLRASEHELPFQMEEEMVGDDAAAGGRAAGVTSQQQQEQAEVAQEVPLGP